jgi:hypothetical protein
MKLGGQGMFGSNIVLKRTPAMADIDLDLETIVFIKNWEAMVNWEKYKALVLVDIDNIYFLLFSIKTEKLLNCYLGVYGDSFWAIDHDRVKTWDCINNVIKVLEVNETIDLGGLW